MMKSPHVPKLHLFTVALPIPILLGCNGRKSTRKEGNAKRHREDERDTDIGTRANALQRRLSVCVHIRCDAETLTENCLGWGLQDLRYAKSRCGQ